MPTMMSTLPAASRDDLLLSPAFVRKRLTMSIAHGKPGEALAQRLACWNASTVVGARTATCLPSITALNAARIATSVLP